MLNTPYYLIDESRLQDNLDIMAQVRAQSGAKLLLALKCFATWAVFPQMREFMDGTTSSSLFEVQLGHEKFGGETHAYSVAWKDAEIPQVLPISDKIIFNSISQLTRFLPSLNGHICGLRLNPGISTSHFTLADPACRYSRLGEHDLKTLLKHADLFSGVMIHNNCENGDFQRFDEMLSTIEAQYAELFKKLSWISLGGGIHFTGKDYPLDAFCTRLKEFANRYEVQVYLEPGEASITQCATLEVTVLDLVHNEKDLAIVDASTEAHMLDLLIYRESAKIGDHDGNHAYLICGKSCLAGDVFGEAKFTKPLAIGDRISIRDAAGYTMVKKNWFNGLQMPAIAIRDRSGNIHLQKIFTYQDYRGSLS